jgi:hypothetical protein
MSTLQLVGLSTIKRGAPNRNSLVQNQVVATVPLEIKDKSHTTTKKETKYPVGCEMKGKTIHSLGGMTVDHLPVERQTSPKQQHKWEATC